MRENYKDIIDEEDILWEKAYSLARQRAREEGDVDLDYDEDLIDKWAEEYYDDLMKG